MPEKKSEKKPEQDNTLTYKGNTTKHHITFARSTRLAYTAIADWVLLRKREKPIARMFHVAYLADRRTAGRPITFVFNGGPGAASAYLHMGALGPRRAVFHADGTLQQPPTRLLNNRESWLRFTDLVFIDPIGTGFSRTIDEKDTTQKKEEEKKEADSGEKKENTEFWELDRDLESLGEFIQKFLSKHHRWTSPVFIAGESYGGFRVAKLARTLQESYGVGLNGAILISPVIEFASLLGSDYNLVHWIELFPSLAATAWVQDQGYKPKNEITLQNYLKVAETFAQNELLTLLGQGAAMDTRRRSRIFRQMARLIGLSPDLVDRCAGRIDHYIFARELLRDQRLYCGLYDASLTAIDPFPDRNYYEGPDPTLAAIDRVFQAAINSQLRQTLSVDTELDYELLSYKVNRAWHSKHDARLFRGAIGAMDDLRYGMVLNPYMKVCIAHGYFDLVTPYFSSHRLTELMKLDDTLRPNLSTQIYLGGHMFYTWEASRKAFAKSMELLYKEATT